MFVKRLDSDLRQIAQRIQDHEVYSLEIGGRSAVTYFFKNGEIWFVLPCVKV